MLMVFSFMTDSLAFLDVGLAVKNHCFILASCVDWLNFVSSYSCAVGNAAS